MQKTHSFSGVKVDRIISLDILRGVAVLGILIMNIQSFSMPSAAYINPYCIWRSPWFEQVGMDP